MNALLIAATEQANIEDELAAAEARGASRMDLAAIRERLGRQVLEVERVSNIELGVPHHNQRRGLA